MRLTDEPDMHVEIRPDEHTGGPWIRGVSQLPSWVNSQLNEQAQGESDLAVEALRQSRIEFTAGRLLVRTPKELHLRNVPLAVSVRAPLGSQVIARCGAGDVTVTGAAGALTLTTSSGHISTGDAAGPAKVETSSGTVRLGAMTKGVRAKTGSGDLELAEVDSASTVMTGSGDVWLGTVNDDVVVRTGSGEVTIAKAMSGRLELHTGSGSVQVSVPADNPAELDLASGSGEARSDLDLVNMPPAVAPPLRIRARSGSGTVIASQATG